MRWYRYVHNIDKDSANKPNTHLLNCQQRLDDQTGNVRYRAKCSCGWANHGWQDTHEQVEQEWYKHHHLKNLESEAEVEQELVT